MQKHIRQAIIQELWRIYYHTTPQIQHIDKALRQTGVQTITLDHLAIIDLPGPHTGISVLSEIFTTLGYVPQGRDYLPEKQNDFLWLAEEGSNGTLAEHVLPQVVVADFRLDEMPPEIRAIIAKYSKQASPSPLTDIKAMASRITNSDEHASAQLTRQVIRYLSGRDWPLPAIDEFRTVHAFNELLAWVLIFGRRPNHFTISVHLLSLFDDLAAFHRFIEQEVKLPLNQDEGVIKGGPHTGIAQGSTTGQTEKIMLADGEIEIPTGFVEFVWRFPAPHAPAQPVLWNDYFTGFVARHANRVIQSLFITP